MVETVIVVLSMLFTFYVGYFTGKGKAAEARNEQRPAPPTTPAVKRTVVKNG